MDMETTMGNGADITNHKKKNKAHKALILNGIILLLTALITQNGVDTTNIPIQILLILYITTNLLSKVKISEIPTKDMLQKEVHHRKHPNLLNGIMAEIMAAENGIMAAGDTRVAEATMAEEDIGAEEMAEE